MIRSGVLFLLIGGLFFLVGCRAAEPTPTPTQPPTLTAQPGFTPTPSPQPASPLPTVVQNESSATTAAPTPAQPAVETQAAVETLPPAETQPPAATQTAEASPSPEPATEAAPTASPAPESATAAAQVCLDVGAFYGDLSIPDDTFFYQGESFTKSWQLKNEGTCTWDAGYTVVYNSGDPLGAPLTNPLPQVVAPGQTVDIHLDMFAPAAGGTYWSNWELQNAQGNRFGLGKTGKDLFWARIQVSWLAPGESAPPGDSAPIGGGGETSAPVSGSCAAQTNPAFVSEVIRLINAARAANGLPALQSECTACRSRPGAQPGYGV
jgi:hypothetical protein